MVIDLFGLSADEVRARFPEVYQWGVGARLSRSGTTITERHTANCGGFSASLALFSVRL
jgi:hypothetical protein